MQGWLHGAIGLEDASVAWVLSGKFELLLFMVVQAVILLELVQLMFVLFLEGVFVKECHS